MPRAFLTQGQTSRGSGGPWTQPLSWSRRSECPSRGHLWLREPEWLTGATWVWRQGDCFWGAVQTHLWDGRTGRWALQGPGAGPCHPSVHEHQKLWSKEQGEGTSPPASCWLCCFWLPGPNVCAAPRQPGVSRPFRVRAGGCPPGLQGLGSLVGGRQVPGLVGCWLALFWLLGTKLSGAKGSGSLAGLPSHSGPGGRPGAETGSVRTARVLSSLWSSRGWARPRRLAALGAPGPGDPEVCGRCRDSGAAGDSLSVLSRGLLTLTKRHILSNSVRRASGHGAGWLASPLGTGGVSAGLLASGRS